MSGWYLRRIVEAMNSNEYLHRQLHEARHQEWIARAAEERLARQVAGPGLAHRLWRYLTSIGRPSDSTARPPTPLAHRRPGASVTR